MNRAAVFSLTFLLGSPFAFSQAPVQSVVAVSPPFIMGESCPVDLQAQRNGMPTVVVTKGQPAEAVQQLDLNWANRRQKKIVAAAVLVHGFDASPRIIPAGNSASPELKKTYAMKLNLSGGGHAITSLTLQRFAVVNSIELRSIEYADGTRWSVAAGESCRITPNSLLLIDATAK